MPAATEPTFPPPPDYADMAHTVDDAITSRRSIRAFLPVPVPRALIEHILSVASRAPSGTNMQPWCVHVVAGEAKASLSKAIVEAFEAGGEEHRRTWKYYPDELFEPYLSRKRAVGWGRLARHRQGRPREDAGAAGAKLPVFRRAGGHVLHD
jgi:nitroreductase